MDKDGKRENGKTEEIFDNIKPHLENEESNAQQKRIASYGFCTKNEEETTSFDGKENHFEGDNKEEAIKNKQKDEFFSAEEKENDISFSTGDNDDEEESVISVENETDTKKESDNDANGGSSTDSEENNIEADTKDKADEEDDDSSKNSELDFIKLLLMDSGELEGLTEAEEEYVVSFNSEEYVNKYSETSGLESVGSLFDALNICINNLGCVDLEYVAALTGKEIPEVIEGLKGAIFRNPLTWQECYYKGYETASEYLSGNLYQKLIDAVRANAKYKGVFDENLDALKEVMPKSAKVFDGDISLGNPLIEKSLIESFLSDVIFKNELGYKVPFKVSHSTLLNKWSITVYSGYGSFSNAEYGTDYMPAVRIVEKMLNFRSLEVYLTIKEGNLIRREVDSIRTEEIRRYADKINKAFQEYIHAERSRIDGIKRRYYETFECYRPRVFDGRYLSLPGKNPNIALKAFQLNAVARIIQTPNTLLAHYVGAGKTYVMIAAGMELRRLGISKRNWYVVPNHLVEQWRKEFVLLYPDAKLRVISPNKFTKAKRKAIIDELTLTDEYDAVIIAYSCMEFLTVSFDEASREYKDYIKELEEEATKKNDMKGLISVALITTRKKLELREKQKHELPFFDQLNIDSIFLDESHNYKNYKIETEIKFVGGINMNYSTKCMEMMEKVRYVQKHGRGVVFATATPITNSFTDIFVLQKYLQNELLNFTELESFDNWAGMYAEAEESMELDATGTSYRLKNRFTKFRNLPELSNMIAGIADVNTNQSNDIKGMTVHTENVVIKKSLAVKRYIKSLVKRAEAVKKQEISPKEDNMLKITIDGRKAALDIRLVESWQPFDPNSRLAAAANKIYELYDKGRANKLAQLVFSDQSTPNKKGVFNVYEDLKARLVAMGVAPSEIAFIHSCKNEKEVEELHEKTRKGEVRILIGSTMKLGIGANVQERLVAIHHLDIPWRPCDMIQREGRLIRPGNTNSDVYVFRYVVEGSFDAYSWQLLEGKQKLISQFLSGEFPAKETDYVDETVLSYAEVKALAVENPKIKTLIDLENKIRQLNILKTNFLREQERMKGIMPALTSEYVEKKGLAERYKADSDTYLGHKDETFFLDFETDKKTRFINRDLAGAELIKHLAPELDEKVLGHYMGFEIVRPECLPENDNGRYLIMRGAENHRVEFIRDPLRLLNRIDTMLSCIPTYAEKYGNDTIALEAKLEFGRKKLASSFDLELELKVAEDKYMELAKEFEEDKNNG